MSDKKIGNMEIVDRMNKKSKMPKKLCRMALYAFWEVFVEALAEGETVQIQNIGKFWTKKAIPARWAWDGIHGKWYWTEHTNRMKFKRAQRFHRAINCHKFDIS